MSPEGERGNVGEPAVSVSQTRNRGPGDHKPWRGGGLPPWPRAHMGHHEPWRQARYRGRERQAKRPETGSAAVVAAQSTGEGGEVRPKRPTGGKATAGQSVPLAGTRGETLRSPTLTPARQWTVAGSRGSA